MSRKTRRASRAEQGTQPGKQLPDGIVLQTSLYAGGAKLLSLAWSPDGKRLAAGTEGGDVLVWNADNWGLVHRVRAYDVEYILALGWSSNDRWVAAAGMGSGSIAMLNPVSGHCEHVFRVPIRSVCGLAISPSGNTLAVGGMDVDGNAALYLLDWTTGQPLGTLWGHHGLVGRIAWRADGQRLVSASGDQTAIIWNPLSAHIDKRLEGHVNEVPCAAWTLDSRRIVTGGFDRTVRVWNADTGEQVAILEGHTGDVWCVAVSSDGRLVASYATDQTVRIWSLDTFEPIARLDIDIPEVGNFFAVLEFHPRRPLLAVISDHQQRINPQASVLSWEEFAACLRRLHQADVITLLDYGAAHQNPGRGVDVLLEPTAVDAYASAITIAARDEPDGLGHRPESDVLEGKFPLEARERLSEPSGERKVLVTVIERFLERDIALRERIVGVDYLVFPSQYTREAPFPGSRSYGLRYDFAGPVESIFATLAVRLAHHTGFKDRRFYRNAASYEALGGGRCIILFEDREEGRGRMSVFFEDAASEPVQQMFLQYVYEHLLRKAVPGSITRRRAYHCPQCSYLFDDEVVERRIARGADHIICPNCDYRAPLYDLILHDTDPSQAPIRHIDADARDAMHRQLAVAVIQGKKRTGRYDVLLSYASADRPVVIWLAECLQSLGLRPWLDVWEMRSDRPLPHSSIAYKKILTEVHGAVVCTAGVALSPWTSEAQHRTLVQYARNTKRVVAALLPRTTGSSRLRTAVSRLVSGHSTGRSWGGQPTRSSTG